MWHKKPFNDIDRQIRDELVELETAIYDLRKRVEELYFKDPDQVLSASQRLDERIVSATARLLGTKSLPTRSQDAAEREGRT